MDGMSGRTFALKELMERSRAPMAREPMAAGENEAEGLTAEHCEKGLGMARAFLDNEENADSPLRPQVEALAAAYADLMSAMEEGPKENEAETETEDY
jgi:hypothetical protein